MRRMIPHTLGRTGSTLRRVLTVVHTLRATLRRVLTVVHILRYTLGGIYTTVHTLRYTWVAYTPLHT